MATSNLATSIVDANASYVQVAKAHQFQVWDPAMPANTPLATAISTYGLPALAITQTGSVGIGTTLPTVALDVAGTITATAFIGDGSQLTGINSGQGSGSGGNYVFASNVGIGTSYVTLSSDGYLTVFDSVNSSVDALRVDQTQYGITPMIIKSNGNIGFGTASPQGNIDVYYNPPQVSRRYPPTNLLDDRLVVAFPYGDGLYVVTASSETGTAYQFMAFNTNYIWGSTSVYNNSTGAYTGSESTSGYLGVWVQLQLPNKGIVPMSYSFSSDASTNRYGAPKDWGLYASNDGSTWTLMDSQTNITFNASETKTFTISNVTTSYIYYRLVINKIQGGGFGITTALFGNLLYYGYPKTKQSITFNNNSLIVPSGYSVGIGTTTVGMAVGRAVEMDVNGTIVADTFVATEYGTETNVAFGLSNYYDATPSTGFFKPTSDPESWAISANSVEVIRGSPVGYGINTTNPLTTLHVKGGIYAIGSIGIGTTPPSLAMLFVQGRTLLAGNVGIGTTNIDSRLRYMLQLNQDSAAKPSTSTWTTTSDARLKENIVTAEYDTCYNVLSNLDLKYYKWRDDIPIISDIKDRHKLGWIASDVQEMFPKAVRTIDEMYGLSNVLDVNVDQIYAAMYGTVKKLIEEMERFKMDLSAVGL